jgi:hypothetical protein
MENVNFESVYSGWPERAFIINKGVIEFISYAQADNYDNWHLDVEFWINNNLI